MLVSREAEEAPLLVCGGQDQQRQSFDARCLLLQYPQHLPPPFEMFNSVRARIGARIGDGQAAAVFTSAISLTIMLITEPLFFRRVVAALVGVVEADA